MWTPSIFVIFVLSQTVAISIIVLVLKGILDRNLINLAIQQLEAGHLNPAGLNRKDFDLVHFSVSVITHKEIAAVDRERVLKAVTKNIPGGTRTHFQVDRKICGGMIIKAGAQTADYSLLDRLKRAR